MWINGDLVRVPQGTVASKENENNRYSLTVITEPQYAIVIDNKPSNRWENVKILLNNEVFLVNSDKIQLVEGSDVYKAI